ncbi:hypothetical protein NXV33_19760 [Bacteroides thetaiotaomicron]|nr:hypothetical protein [Bacteroides thetaiotaomicron]
MAERATIILKSQQEILDITGPGLLTDTYWDNYGMYTDITLLRNTDKRCRQPYHNEISCHFGDYAGSSACRDMENGNLSLYNQVMQEKLFYQQTLKESL